MAPTQRQITIVEPQTDVEDLTGGLVEGVGSECHLLWHAGSVPVVESLFGIHMGLEGQEGQKKSTCVKCPYLIEHEATMIA